MKKIFLKLSRFNMQKVLVFGLLAGAVYYFTLFDDGSAIDAEIATTNTQVQEQEKKQQESDAALKEVEKIRAQVASLGEQYKLISAQIPTEIQPSEVLRTIDSMSATAGVSIKSKEPQKTERKEILEEMPIHVQANGTFSEITLFLFNMMNTERISRILNFTITQPPSVGNQPKSKVLNLDVLFANYRFVGEPKPEEKKE